MAKQHRLPTKPLNPISRTASDPVFPAIIAGNGALAAAALVTAVIGVTVNANAWMLNTAFASLGVFLTATTATLALLRAKLTVRVGYYAGLVGALKKVDPALVYKALPLYDAGLKIMVSEHICGGNEVMREKVGDRVKKIRELSTAHEASRIHTLGDHDLNNASTLIENLSRPAIEARQTAAAQAAEEKAAAAKRKEEESVARYNARKAAERAATAVEPDAVIPKYARVELKNQDPEPKKDREKVK